MEFMLMKPWFRQYNSLRYVNLLKQAHFTDLQYCIFIRGFCTLLPVLMHSFVDTHTVLLEYSNCIGLHCGSYEYICPLFADKRISPQNKVVLNEASVSDPDPRSFRIRWPPRSDFYLLSV
jgi:hypothetical protein